MTREMGKVLKETRGDVQEAIDAAYYNAGEGRRMFGSDCPVGTTEQVRDGGAAADRVCGMITPGISRWRSLWKLLARRRPAATLA